MDPNEASKDKWKQLYKREEMMGTADMSADEQFSEALELFESMEDRQSSNGDVVNWDERAEMAAAAQRNPGLIQSDEDSQPTQDAPSMNEDGQQQGQQTGYGYEREQQATEGAQNEQEQELMSGLAGIMEELENYENDKQ